MKLGDFEAMIVRGGYRFEKRCEMDDGEERRIYVSSGRGPKINVLCRVIKHGLEVEDLHALTVEAMLDEENYFQD